MSDIETAAKAASAGWKAAFNAGNAKACAAYYEEGAVMTVKPFGTFTGRAEIEGFWEKIIGDGFTEVDYLDPQFSPVDNTSVRLASGWKMNKAHGVITNELWVMQPDGSLRLRTDEFEVQG
ncbi:isochorismatase (plasmid) [Phaeobacter inhibens]|uniref:YybH family protein n=1 Tax=Phaeobacter inhibens TaxID=221822 RepID=UPI0009719604|nr:isochorismatase [Phaeobacter inhibens]APX18014.1 isochorismatase [Phaeobacter inhibens]